MNLAGNISERLWNEVKAKYEGRNFTGAILDSIYFLSELIREKTGLEADGVSLVGQAFGGKNPKLKVNKCQTESEWNVQQGIEQMLRGVYQALRNPRSHEKFNDPQDDADSIIVFIDYLLKVIDQSKAHFSKTEFLPRIFDPGFVQSERYSALLIEEIPVKERFDIFLEVFGKRETGDPEKLKHFLLPLLANLSPEEQAQVYESVSDEFKITDRKESIRTAIQVLPPNSWLQLSEVARLRIENKFINDVKEGAFLITTSKCKAGAFGTWSNRVFEYFSNKSLMMGVLTQKLFSKNREEQDYVLQFFLDSIEKLAPEPGVRFLEKYKEALQRGDKRFYNALSFPCGPDKYREALEKELAAFKESPLVANLPHGIEDEDVPF